MATLSIIVSGQTYSTDATDAQIAGLGASCEKVMRDLPLGEGQDANTPASQRPGFESDKDYLAYIFGTIPVEDRSNDRLDALLTAYARDSGYISDGQPATQPDPTPLSGDALRASLMTHLLAKAASLQSVTSAITVNIAPDGQPPQNVAALVSAAGRVDIVGMLAAAAIGQTPQWIQGGVLTPITLTQLQTIGLAVMQFRATLVAVESALEAGIYSNPPTVTTTTQIDTAPWPSNS